MSDNRDADVGFHLSSARRAFCVTGVSRQGCASNALKHFVTPVACVGAERRKDPSSSSSAFCSVHHPALIRFHSIGMSVCVISGRSSIRKDAAEHVSQYGNIRKQHACEPPAYKSGRRAQFVEHKYFLRLVGCSLRPVSCGAGSEFRSARMLMLERRVGLVDAVSVGCVPTLLRACSCERGAQCGLRAGCSSKQSPTPANIAHEKLKSCRQLLPHSGHPYTPLITPANRSQPHPSPRAPYNPVHARTQC